MTEVSVLTVFLAALTTALCTGLGVAPFLFVPNISKRWLGIGTAMAAGLMLGASLGLGIEAAHVSWSGLAGGLLPGVLLMVLASLLVPEPDLESHAAQEDSNHAGFRKMLLLMIAMTAHSFAEGIGVGVSFAGREGLGELITAAIAIHNIPEGLAIALVMIPRGVTMLRASLWAVFSSLPQPLMAVPAFMFVTWFQPVLSVGLGLAAGAMVYMVVVELVPEALTNIGVKPASIVIAIATMAMLAFQFLLT